MRHSLRNDRFKIADLPDNTSGICIGTVKGLDPIRSTRNIVIDTTTATNTMLLSNQKQKKQADMETGVNDGHATHGAFL